MVHCVTHSDDDLIKKITNNVVNKFFFSVIIHAGESQREGHEGGAGVGKAKWRVVGNGVGQGVM